MEATRESQDALPVRTGRVRRPQRRVRRATVLVAVCAAAATLLTPAVARANGNGQQVSFTLAAPGCGSGLGAVTISGRNQSNRSVTWSGSSGNGQDAFASGWWWVGNSPSASTGGSFPASSPRSSATPCAIEAETANNRLFANSGGGGDGLASHEAPPAVSATWEGMFARDVRARGGGSGSRSRPRSRAGPRPLVLCGNGRCPP